MLPGLAAARAQLGRAGAVGSPTAVARCTGARRYVDLHMQFRAGTTLEAAHGIAHGLQDRIAASLRGADVLIHLEPEDKVREDPIGDPALTPASSRSSAG